MSQTKTEESVSSLDFSSVEKTGFFDQSIYQDGLVLSVVRADVARMAEKGKPVLRDGKPVLFPVLVLDKVEDENGSNVVVPPSLVGEGGTDKAIVMALSVPLSPTREGGTTTVPFSSSTLSRTRTGNITGLPSRRTGLPFSSTIRATSARMIDKTNPS